MDVLRQAGSVLLVFSLLGGVLWALRRGGNIGFSMFTGKGFASKRASSQSRSMAVVERLALTPQHTLHLIRIHGREILVATHPQGCIVVSEPAPAERAMGAKA